MKQNHRQKTTWAVVVTMYCEDAQVGRGVYKTSTDQDKAREVYEVLYHEYATMHYDQDDVCISGLGDSQFLLWNRATYSKLVISLEEIRTDAITTAEMTRFLSIN